MLRPFILIGFLSGATGALAEPVSLTGETLQQAVSGSVVAIDTPLGTTVPMRFGKDGLVSAEAGVLAPVLGSAKDRGRWWVEGDKLCTKWFRWFDAGVRCLTIRQEGSRIYWRKVDDGEQGTGTLIDWKPPATEKKPVVVAKAEPAPRKTQAPREEPVSPREQPVAALPPSEPAAKQAASVPEPKRKPAPETVALADTSAKTGVEEGPTMRFGGAGLLEASARIAQPPQPAPEPAPEANTSVTQEVAVERPRAEQPNAKPDAKAAAAKDNAAAAKAGRKASQQHAALDSAASAKRTLKRKQASSAKSRAREIEVSDGRPSYRVTGVHRYDVLNVRRGPSETHEQIAAIPPTGRQVQITGDCRADWCPIRYGRITGWVNSYYLAEERPSQASASRVYVSRP